jgi:penicillin-binding protein 1A
MSLQRVAEETVENKLKQYGQEYDAKQAALVVADVEGGVRAMVGGRDYASSQFNRATDALRQPGSSFKPYVYAAALAHGLKPTSIVVDSPVCIGNWCPQNYSGGFAGSMTVTVALTRSINTIAVKLATMVGNGSPRAGRAKIVELAKKMGLRTPLTDTPSLPIGAGEVTVLDHTVAYATFPNGGKAVVPHAVLEVRTGNGEVVWRFDRDGKKPQQVMSPQVANDMNMMMSKVVDEGTARRAALEGIRAAGKTGTTNAYRDAWFVGYTGNFVCGVWYGNDDYAPLNRMTGGSLPAMTWHDVMAFAHQGVEIKQIPGLVPSNAKPQVVADTSRADPSQRPTNLTRRGADVLLRVERLFDDATRTLAVSAESSAPASQQRGGALEYPDAIASSDRRPAVRGN